MKKIKFEDILACPICKSNLAYKNNKLLCENKHSFEKKNGIWFFYPNNRGVSPFNEIWDNVYDKSNIEYFQKKLDYYSDKTNSVTFKEYYVFIELLKKHIPNLKIKNYLDLGCGTGSYSLALSFVFDIKNIILVDKSVTALLVAKKLLQYYNRNCVLMCADGFSLPFKDNVFDLSITSGLFEHFSKEEQETIVSEQCRVANLISCQLPADSLSYWIYRKIVEIKNNGWPFGYEKPLKYVQSRRLFEKCRFTEIDYRIHNLFSSFLFSELKNKKYEFLYNKNIFNKVGGYEYVQIFKKK